MGQNVLSQIYRITNNEEGDTIYERNRIFTTFALKTADG